MIYETKTESAGAWALEYPKIEGATSLNKYFDELILQVKDFCQSEELPEFARYYVSFTLVENNDAIQITTTLSLRKRGKTIGRKQICTSFNGDFIEKQTVTELI